MERSVIFSGRMVRAILAGRKSQTRRLAWRGGKPSRWQSIERGDELWVREAWYPCKDGSGGVIYRANRGDDPQRIPWKSPLWLPREKSRITLRVREAHIEPLQWLTEEDAIAEGARSVEDFGRVWREIHEDPDAAWERNPAVVVVRFQVQSVADTRTAA